MTSGFGKIILLGEHAVVYGHPALAGAVSLRVAARVKPATTSSLEVPAWQLGATESDDSDVTRALLALIGACCPKGERWRIAATSTLPSRAGLGSSAALSVAIARALATAHGEVLDDAEIEARADSGERCFHDTPSGVDVAVAARGGLGLFTKDGGFDRIDAAPVSLVVGLTGEPRKTSDLVGIVADAVERDPAGAEAMLDTLGDLAQQGAKIVCDVDDETRATKLGALFEQAQELLRKLGVSSPGIDRLIEIARDAGAVGCKLTGAGGGGAVIAMAPGNEDEVARAWRQQGFEAFVAKVGVTQFSQQQRQPPSEAEQ